MLTHVAGRRRIAIAKNSQYMVEMFPFFVPLILMSKEERKIHVLLNVKWTDLYSYSL